MIGKELVAVSSQYGAIFAWTSEQITRNRTSLDVSQEFPGSCNRVSDLTISDFHHEPTSTDPPFPAYYRSIMWQETIVERGFKGHVTPLWRAEHPRHHTDHAITFAVLDLAPVLTQVFGASYPPQDRFSLLVFPGYPLRGTIDCLNPGFKGDYHRPQLVTLGQVRDSVAQLHSPSVASYNDIVGIFPRAYAQWGSDPLNKPALKEYLQSLLVRLKSTCWDPSTLVGYVEPILYRALRPS